MTSPNRDTKGAALVNDLETTMHEWVDTGHGDHELHVAVAPAKSWDGTVVVVATVEHTVDAAALQGAKSRAETHALREVYAALTEHFAPVLRWTLGDDGEYTAVIEGWELSARDCNWSLVHSSGARLLAPRPNQADAAPNRSAAAAALRAMGVTFRLEESTP